jgi:2-phosphoglycerate kinase
MAQSLMACGLPPDRAYRVARIVDIELRRGAVSLVTTDELRERVHAALEREEGADALDRYRRWHDVRHLERTLVLMIGGAAGVGKSTIATEIAHRLGITRIVSTDVIRQVMRGMIPRDIVPQIHTSSYGAAAAIPQATAADRTIVGFAQQADTVAVGVRGVVERAIEERFPLALEGVHLIPGTPLVDQGAEVTLVELLAVVPDEEAHQSHFYLRSDHTGQGRPVGRYLQAFGEIREIQDFLIAAAERAGVEIVDSTDLDAAVRRVMDKVLALVAAPAGLVTEPTAAGVGPAGPAGGAPPGAT